MPALTTRPFDFRFAWYQHKLREAPQALAILYGFHNSCNCLSIGRSLSFLISLIVIALLYSLEYYFTVFYVRSKVL